MGLRSLLSREGDERLLKAVEETNSLLRELIQVMTGRQALTRVSNPQPRRIRDETDVTVVTRQTVLQVEREKREKERAPWRASSNGQVSAPPRSVDGAPTSSPPPPRVML